jgi:hypothetical protein
VSTKQQYMERARECVKHYEGAHSPEERLGFLQMAHAWHRLAEGAEQIEELVDEAKDRGILPKSSR